MQSAIVLVITAIADLVLATEQRSSVVFRIVQVVVDGVAAALVIFPTLKTSARYPLNYAILALLAIEIGLRWSFGENALAMHAHFHLLGIMCVAMCVAVAAELLAVIQNTDPLVAAAVPLLLGWVAGSAATVLVVGYLGGDLLWAALAALASLCQLLWLFAEMREAFRSCDPDSFVKVILCLDWSLLVVVLGPQLMMVACIIRVWYVVYRPEARGENPELQALPRAVELV